MDDLLLLPPRELLPHGILQVRTLVNTFQQNYALRTNVRIDWKLWFRLRGTSAIPEEEVL